MCFLLCGAYPCLSLCNLSEADSQIRYYIPMNRKQAWKCFTPCIYDYDKEEYTDSMHGMLFPICACYQPPADNQDLAQDVQYDKLHAREKQDNCLRIMYYFSVSN